MAEVKDICYKWSVRTHASRCQHQQLTGKLLYIHHCVRPAQLFVNQILGFLRNAPARSSIKLPQSFFKDIAWFQKFLKFFNGSVEIYPSNSIIEEAYVDASLQRVGGIYGNKVFTCPIPLLIQNLCSIVHFEVINIVLAIRTWYEYWANQ